MATAFKAILKFVAQDGSRFQYPCTVSDVNAAFYVFQDANGDVILPSMNGILYLVDVILSAAGADTTTADIFVNGKPTGEQIMNAANTTAVIGRQFEGNAVAIAPGARLKITQNT